MKPHDAWFLKAEHDLISARKLMEGDNPVLNTAIYHTQQCAEKALKGYLAYKNQPVQKTHNLAVLIELCGKIDERFVDLLSDAAELTPYGITFRCPDFEMEPDESDVWDAIEKAKRIFNFCKEHIG